MSTNLNLESVLVVGATGQVGSNVVRKLVQKGKKVRALVRQEGKTIHGLDEGVEYVVGDLSNRVSLEKAVQGMEAVVSTANAVIPVKARLSVKEIHSRGYDNLIEVCEQAGVRRFVQSSTPSHPKFDKIVPELAGKRIVEERLERSRISTIAIRNPAFTDVWMVMAGCQQASSKDPHATTQRPYGFAQTFIKMVGNFARDRKQIIAYGGAKHGAPFISTQDVAELLAAAIDYKEISHKIFETGGPEWVTWGEIAEILAARFGYSKISTLPFPSFAARTGSILTKPFSSSASNILALCSLVSGFQPKWDSRPVVEELQVPPLATVEEYLNQNFQIA